MILDVHEWRFTSSLVTIGAMMPTTNLDVFVLERWENFIAGTGGRPQQ